MNPNESPTPKKSTFGMLIPIVLLLCVAYVLLSSAGAAMSIPYSEAVSLFENEQVKSFTTKDDLLTMELHKPYKDERTVVCELGSTEYFREDMGELIAEQKDDGILKEYDYQPDSETPWLLELLPYVLLCGGMVVVWMIMMNRSNGGNNGMAKFGKANARVGLPENKKYTFDDVAGVDEEKEELREIVDYLRNPEKYSTLGAKIPKGVLLVGPPGTGKTLIARAVAGEADVQFLSISGSDFVEMYVGVGASRVRDLFESAKKMAPSIVFIDEIDAVGRRRGAGLGGGHDEREQTLNQLLVEMDGFGQNEGVIVMAATNRKDILDPALLRPGRFDRQIYIGAPDVKGREAILQVHAKNKKLAEDVDLNVLAKATGGFTGADLSNLLNEGALHAARNNRPVVTMDDLEEAIMKVIAGPPKHTRIITQHEQRLTAIHEAGHAIAMYHLKTHDPVHQITIIPRGGAGGMTISLPEEDQYYASRNQMFETIVSLLGGRIAEALELDDISTGASNDIERATTIARNMVAKYGMSKRIGTVSYERDGEIFVGRDYEKTKSYSERVAGEIDEETKAVVDEAYLRCETILKENLDKLREVAEFLLVHKTMNRVQFEACMEGREIPENAACSIFQSKEEHTPCETNCEKPESSEASDAEERTVLLEDSET